MSDAHNNTSIKSRKRRLMNLLMSVLSNEMDHAILNIVETPHYVLKVFLTFFLLIATGLAAYTTILLVMNYLDFGVITTLRKVRDTPAQFPQITICNINPFTTQYAYTSFKTYFNSISYNGTDYNSRSYAGILTQNILLASETQTGLSHSWQDILLSCRFNYLTCTADDFVWYFDEAYGNCVKFNSGFNSSTNEAVALKRSFLAGSNYGLQLELYVNYYENLTEFNSINGGLGVIIRVDNAPNVVDYSYDGILVNAGRATFVSLSKTNKFALSRPYSNCDLDNDKYTDYDSTLFRRIVNSNYSYSQQFCVSQCLQEIGILNCNCTASYIASVFSAKRCVTQNETVCFINVFFEIFNSKNYVQEKCIPQCPLECNSTKFDYSLSDYQLLGNYYVNMIKENTRLASDFVTRMINVTTVQESVVKVNVFYASLSYMKSEESPQWDWISLVAYLGGNFGLFLGFSLFSLSEYMQMIFEYYYFRKKSALEENK